MELDLIYTLAIPRIEECPDDWREIARNDPDWWLRIIDKADSELIASRLAIASIY